jgi:hypothetical protein
MAMAFRPRVKPNSMASRKGSQAEGIEMRCSDPNPLNSTSNPVVTSLAGLAGDRRPQAAGGRIAMPAALT